MVGTRVPRARHPRRGWPNPRLLWSPFFLLAHLWVLVSGTLGISESAANGFSQPYYHAAAMGTISVALVGAELLRRALAGAFPGRIAGGAVLAIVLLSPILYYVLVVPTMAHALVFGVSGAAVFALAALPVAVAELRGGSLRWPWVAAGVATSLLVFSPQLVAWQILYGTPVTVPQGGRASSWTDRVVPPTC